MVAYTTIGILFFYVVVLNVLTTAADMAWYLRPLTVIRWVLVDKALEIAPNVGGWTAHFWAAVAERLSIILDPFILPIADTSMNLVAIGLSGIFVVDAFMRGWLQVIVEYSSVNFLISPGGLFYSFVMTVLCVLICTALYLAQKKTKTAQKNATQLQVRVPSKRRRRSSDSDPD